MSASIPLSLYPVALIQDRYRGTYSDGEWLAIANADVRQGEMARASWILAFGPYGDDVEAATFWASKPDWVTAGATPADALERLLQGRS